MEKTNDGSQFDKGYKYFSRGLSLILMVLVLVPLTVMAILSHYQYRNLLQKEELDQLFLNLEGSVNTIEKFISELQSIVKFVAHRDRYEDLIDQNKLEAIYDRLQSEYPDFVDIEVIDVEGKQQAYVGPYQLKERSYTNQTWYKQVLEHGVFISNIFTGFRDVPHFVIAVSRPLSRQQGSWVLRTTIEGNTLQKIIDTVNTNYADDIFLIDSDCHPQTAPKKYGRIGEQCTLPALKETTTPGFKKQIAARKLKLKLNKEAEIVIDQKSFMGRQLIQSVVDLTGTPWKLVLVKEQYLYADAWRLFLIHSIGLFLACAVIAILVIKEISHVLTNHIRESDRKRQQFHAEAEHSNKLASIGRLAAGVAHEINNPLSVINQKAGLIEDYMEMTQGFEHKEIMQQSLSAIQNSVARCKKITHRLLGFARQTDVEKEEIDVNSTLREVIDFLAREAQYNQIRIEFDLEDNVKKVFSDRGQLQQVFLNIVNNAIDAIGSNGKIMLSSRQIDGDTLQVKISDDGPGMSEEVKQHIFDPFFTTKKTGKGTGLGLSICYGLVKKLGGNITVESELNKGTTFKITLPACRPNGESV